MMKAPVILLLSISLAFESLASPIAQRGPTMESDKEQAFKHIAELFCQVKSNDGQAKVKNDSNLFKVEDNVLCGKNNKGGLCRSLCEGDANLHENVECIARIVTQKGTKADEIFRKFCDGKS